VPARWAQGPPAPLGREFHGPSWVHRVPPAEAVRWARAGAKGMEVLAVDGPPRVPPGVAGPTVLKALTGTAGPNRQLWVRPAPTGATGSPATPGPQASETPKGAPGPQGPRVAGCRGGVPLAATGATGPRGDTGAQGATAATVRRVFSGPDRPAGSVGFPTVTHVGKPTAWNSQTDNTLAAVPPVCRC